MEKERPWLAQYPAGIPANINPEEYATLNDLLDETFKKYAGLPAFSSMGKTFSFKKIDRYSRQFAAYLQSRGLEPGDKIALMMPNMLSYPVALFGALRAGLVVVNTNPLYTPREMKHQFTDSGVKAIVICENFAANLEKILPETNIKTVIVTPLGEFLGFFKGNLVNFVVKYIKRLVPKYQLDNVVCMQEAIKQGSKFTIKPFASGPNDTILLQYTGGTTGVSKGAMLTHRNLVANMLQIRAVMRYMLREGEETALSPLPMYHIFAFSVNCLALMSIGTHTVLVTNARDLPSVIKPFKQYKISILTGVNTLFNALLNHPTFAELDFTSLKVTVGGGMAVQRTVAERWQQTTGCPLSEGYGMTETSPVVCVNPIDGSGRLGTIGLPVPSTDVRIADEEGHELPVGEVGELQVKGPQVMKGYYQRPEETTKSFTDGWLRTGDLAVALEGGYFQLIDRIKDMINVSGFNVYPNEIEEVMSAHPKVHEVAAIGIADDKSGEAVKLFVVAKDAKLKSEELMVYARENLTAYKVPKQIEFCKELPKTNVGKILRRALREPQ
jgi:long-chain acyl-CoA synthetase